MDLSELRKEIDLVDRQLVSLFGQRMEIVENVLRFKQENGLAIFQPDREHLLIDKVGELADPKLCQETRQLFTQMMDISKEVQFRMLHPDVPEFSCTDRAKVLVTTEQTTTAVSYICGLAASLGIGVEELCLFGNTITFTLTGPLDQCDILQRLWAVYTPGITIQ